VRRIERRLAALRIANAVDSLERSIASLDGRNEQDARWATLRLKRIAADLRAAQTLLERTGARQ
jgi:hypothetical protein